MPIPVILKVSILVNFWVSDGQQKEHQPKQINDDSFACGILSYMNRSFSDLNNKFHITNVHRVCLYGLVLALELVSESVSVDVSVLNLVSKVSEKNGINPPLLRFNNYIC